VSDKKGLSAPVASAPSRRVSQGPVMPNGGAEETEPGGEILERFADLACGSDARIVIIPTASQDPRRSGEGYAKQFRKMGAKEADWLRIERREDANSEPTITLLKQASGIYITGGDQSRLVRLLVGTLVMECIRLRNADGVVVAGTSAGASILPALMMAGGTGVGGDSNGAVARPEHHSMIEIRGTKIYRGPNVWVRMPVIHLSLDIGELQDRSTNEIPGFYERLTELIPSLYDHECSLGHPGGFLERLREGTLAGHVIEHVAIELQNLAGGEVVRGKTRGTAEPGVYDVVYAYTQEDVGLAAGKLAVRLINHLIHGAEPEFDFVDELEEGIIRLAEQFAYGPSTAAIVAAAEREGIPVLRLHPARSLVQLGHGRHQQRIWATVTSATSDIAEAIAGDKDLTNRLLRDVGIPAPRGELVRNIDQAITAAARIGYPVVLKPLDGNHGRGVCLDLGNEAEISACFPSAASESRDGRIIVERYLTGKDYRILVVDKRVVAVAERVPAHVVGDGVSTIAELVEIANADPRRGVGHEKVLTRIPLNERTLETLDRQGLALDSVPDPGQQVWLQQTGNMSIGGTSIDRTDEIHPVNAEIARQAAMILREDENPRGRARGEMAALLRQAVLDAGLPEHRIHIVTDEVAAAHAGVDLAAPGDLIVVLIDRVTLVWEALAQRAEHEANQSLVARNGHSITRDISSPEMPTVPNGRAVPAARKSPASRKQRDTA
jgi:D-alanine-D-alanine ligase-like ATP-grasp enzyme